jgi:hypothetical protein
MFFFLNQNKFCIFLLSSNESHPISFKIFKIETVLVRPVTTFGASYFNFYKVSFSYCVQLFHTIETCEDRKHKMIKSISFSSEFYQFH